MADATAKTSQPRPEPAIRTMRSDISEFLRTTKPSLVSLLARQAQWEEYRAGAGRGRRRWLIVVLAAAAVGAVGTTGLWLYAGRLAEPPPAATPAEAPAPFFYYETVADLVVGPGRADLRTAIRVQARGPIAVGTFRRIIVRADDQASPIGLAEALGHIGARAPAAFIETAVGRPQLFLYRDPVRAHLGLAVETKNPNRALQALLTAEPSLARDLEALFPDPPPLTIAPFGDATYRNISYRYLPLDPTGSRGLGYLHFPARRLIVIATSDSALRATIDRLFE